MNLSSKAPSKQRSLDEPTAPHGGARRSRACAAPLHHRLHSVCRHMVRPLSLWYVPPSPTPGPRWYAPPLLAAPPRWFPREKPGLPLPPWSLLQFPRCLPAPPRPGCPRWLPGPSHCPMMSVGGRCCGRGPRTWMGGGGEVARRWGWGGCFPSR